MLLTNIAMKTKILLAVTVLTAFTVTQFLIVRENIRLKADNSYLSEQAGAGLAQLHALASFIDVIQNSGISVRDDMKENGEIPGNGPLMVCRFSEYDCTECIEYAIRQMIGEMDSTGMDLLLLGNYRSMSGMKSLAGRVDPDGTCVLANAVMLDLPVDNHGNPYYFIMDTLGVAFDVFVPDRMDKEMSDTYFDIVRKKWHAY